MNQLLVETNNQKLNNLEKLLYLRGIAAEYYSYSGDLIAIPWEDRLQLLREMGDDPTDEAAIETAIYELDAKPWLSWLQSQHIISKGKGDYVDIRINPAQYDERFEWSIKTEAGDVIVGEFIPAHLDEVGDYYRDDIRYSARRLYLTDLPLGYHEMSVGTKVRQQQTLLIVAPETCFQGELENQGVWGIICQLYTLRSDRNWGIGDFTDLAELIELGAAAGMDLISLNPLHAPYTVEMDIASPYSPSDRRFLNPLYLDPTAVKEFSNLKTLDSLSKNQLAQQLSRLRDQDLVDYEAVARLKYCAYDQMFQYFLDHDINSNSQRAIEFHQFVVQHGEALSVFARFESQNFGLTIQSAGDFRFHQYLQWLAYQQLSYCQMLAKNKGMRIGLMKDLAVGAVKMGAEISANPDLFCQNATIGAPPDPLAEQGQNWDLPALDPIALKESNYQHFKDLLQANMSACGGLRIDHILGLLRLWWCHPHIQNGAYVYYPMDDLLAILCLESQRNECLVVGEDMGVVPDEVRAAMKQKSIYSNKVFYFEKAHDRIFKQPQLHQLDALFMITNHDVPTLAGWWDGADLQIRKEIGLIDPEQALIDALEQRRHEKIELLNWLQSLQLLPDSWRDYPVEKAFDFDLCSAIVIAGARSRSRMMLLQLDDLQLLQKPVNIPGTHRQYPNWQRKQKLTTKALFDTLTVQTLFASINQQRFQ